MDILLILAAIAAVIVYIYLRNKRKAEAWEGVVADKHERSITHEDGDDSEWYELVVKLPNGEFKTVEVKEKLYNQFNQGDKIVKEAGQHHPRKG